MTDSEPAFDTTWDTPSDATVDEVQSRTCCFGAPLTRMVNLEYLSSSSSSQSTDLEDSEDFVRDDEINLIEENMSLFDLALARHDGEDADDDPSLRSPTHAYVHHVIDHLSPQTQGSSFPQVGIPYAES